MIKNGFVFRSDVSSTSLYWYDPWVPQYKGRDHRYDRDYIRWYMAQDTFKSILASLVGYSKLGATTVCLSSKDMASIQSFNTR